MNETYLLIYHKEDNDGVFSAAIFYDYLTNYHNVSKNAIQLFGANYNDLKDFMNSNSDLYTLHDCYSNIIMVDISFDSDYMKQLYDEFGNHFIWCDHHAPIIKESYKQNFNTCPGIRNTDKSAILCVYEFLWDVLNEKYNQVNINKPDIELFPELFRILSGWDSWSYEREGYTNEYCRNINKGVTVIYGLDFNKILQLVHQIVKYYNDDKSYWIDGREKHLSIIHNMYDSGRQLNNYDDKTMQDIILNSGDMEWEVEFDYTAGNLISHEIHQACAIFHQGATNSLMFKCLKGTDIKHGLVFKHQPNGNWVLSMYNVNDDENAHCGEILKQKYNGGGHKGAAGCTLTQSQFIKLLKSKTI